MRVALLINCFICYFVWCLYGCGCVVNAFEVGDEVQALCDMHSSLHPSCWPDSLPCNSTWVNPCDIPLTGVSCEENRVTQLY